MMNTMIVVALTIFGEAAGEPIEGKRAVASVIWQRAGGDANNLTAVCLAPAQFSCWNDGKRPRVPDDWPSRRSWRDCKAIAEEMVSGTFTQTIQADHFHTTSVSPRWASGMKFVAVIGKHRFYMKRGK